MTITRTPRPVHRTRRPLLAIGLSAALLAATACGGDDDQTIAAPDTDPPPAADTPDTDPDADDTPDTDPDDPGPGATLDGELLTAADLPDGFDRIDGAMPLFDEEPLCSGAADPAPTISDAIADQWALPDFAVLVAAEASVLAGEPVAYLDWLVGELERCDGTENSFYDIEPLGAATVAVTISVDFSGADNGDVTVLSTSWITAVNDAVVTVHVLDGGEGEVDGAALLDVVADRVG